VLENLANGRGAVNALVRVTRGEFWGGVLNVAVTVTVEAMETSGMVNSMLRCNHNGPEAPGPC